MEYGFGKSRPHFFSDKVCDYPSFPVNNYQNYYGGIPQTSAPWTQTSHSHPPNPIKVPSALPSKEILNNQFQLRSEQIGDSAQWKPSLYPVTQISQSYPSQPVKLPSVSSEEILSNQFQLRPKQISDSAPWNPSLHPVTQTSNSYPSHKSLSFEEIANNQYQLLSEQISGLAPRIPSLRPVTQTNISHASHPLKLPSPLPSNEILKNKFQLDSKKVSEDLYRQPASKPLPVRDLPSRKFSRKKYTKVTNEKKKALLRAYNADRYINGKEKRELADEIGEPCVFIEKWFANRRHLEKKKESAGFAKIEILDDKKNRTRWIPMEHTMPQKATNMTLESIVAEAVSVSSPDSGISSGPVTPINTTIEEFNRSRYNDDLNDLLDAVASHITDPVWMAPELPILDDWVVAQELEAVESYKDRFTM